MTARDPRDVALDALVQARSATASHLSLLDARIAELKGAGKAADRRKHACPHAGCGLKFFREDQVRDHLELVHWDKV